MTPQELKNSILQLAIEGKLVPQHPEEGTAEKLYRQIQAEKQALIKAGKIKKESPLPEITEDEKPFDIPESWKWVRLNEIASSSLGKTLNKATDKGDLCPYLCSINVYWDGISLDTIKEASFTEEDKAKYKLERGDLLICEGGDAGRCAIWDDDRTMYYQNALHRVRFYGDISVTFYKAILEFYKYNGTIKVHCKGETIQHLVQSELYSILFPLPPLAEQKRIVAKIEELLPLIDRYEEAWTKLEAFNKRFPGDLQKSLLQMAIQGKLVPQLPEEGTGEELYAQIQTEKQSLIKSGKLKKEKPLPEITDDEKPFDIPESWRWVRLPEIAEMCLGKMLDKQKNNGILCKYLRNVNVRWDGFDLSDILEMKFEDADDPRFLIQYGDIVMCEGGEPGRCAVWESNDTFHFQKALHRIRFPRFTPARFWYYVFRFYSVNGIFASLFTGTTIKHLTGQALEKLIVPLPPLAEQKRIVAKLENLLPLCERLK